MAPPTPPDRSASYRALPSGPIHTIDRYQLVSRLGKGGMAEVYRAKLTSIGGFERDVALKVLLPGYAAEPEFAEMLLDEARIAGAIDHPNVVKVLDVGRKGDLFYLVMEYVDGRDLRSIAKRIPGARIPLGMSLHIISEVLRGLDAVHRAVDERGQPRKIVHRDVSPGNVLIDRHGFVKLGDFGIARASGRITRTRVGAIKGKSRYMAPEQLAGVPIDHRADLYAVGVTLFEALFGDFARQSSRPSIYGPMFTWPERLPAGAIPAEVEQILRRAITEDPGRRYADAAEMRADLELAIYRSANGYGADVLARELRRILGETSSAVAIGSSDALRSVRWRGLPTAEHSVLPPPPSASNDHLPVDFDQVLASTTQPRLVSLQADAINELRTGASDRLRRPSSLGRRLLLGLVVAVLALVTIAIAAAVAGPGGTLPLPFEEPHPPASSAPVRAGPLTTPLLPAR